MLHNEARKLLVKGYETTHDVEGIAKAYWVSNRSRELQPDWMKYVSLPRKH